MSINKYSQIRLKKLFVYNNIISATVITNFIGNKTYVYEQILSDPIKKELFVHNNIISATIITYFIGNKNGEKVRG